MKLCTLILLILLAMNVVYADNYEFRVNMSVQATKGKFNPATDIVTVRGLFNGWGSSDTLLDGNSDLIYTKTFSLTPGDSTYFKFVYHDASADSVIWENINNRIYVYPSGGGVYEDYFERDSVLPPPTYWQQTSQSIDSRVYALINVESDSTTIILAGTEVGIYRSTNLGDSWVPSGLTSIRIASLEKDSNGTIYAGTGNTGIYKSTDKGVTWTFTGLTGLGVNILFSPSGGNIFAGTEGNGIYISSDSGSTWSQLNNGLGYYQIYGITADVYGRPLFGTYGGGIYSFNNPFNDTLYQHNTGLTNLNILGLTKNANGYIFAATYGGGIYRSKDNGNTWAPVDSGITDTQFRTVHAEGGYIYAGSFSGKTYLSTNDGDAWTQLTPVLPSVVRSFTFTATGIGFVSTHSNGVWSTNDPSWDYFQICSSANGWGGTITPMGGLVQQGNNLTFTITPYEGYRITNFKVGRGTEQDPCSFIDYEIVSLCNSITPMSYTVTDVQSNIHITVDFELDPTPMFQWLGGTGNIFSNAFDVSDDGLVVGTIRKGTDPVCHAFYWNAEHGLIDMSSSPSEYSVARKVYVEQVAINESNYGQHVIIVGSKNSGNTRHAFLFKTGCGTITPPNGTMVDLEPLDEYSNSDAFSVVGGGNHCRVVGSSSNGDFYKATTWDFSFNSMSVYGKNEAHSSLQNKSITYDVTQHPGGYWYPTTGNQLYPVVYAGVQKKPQHSAFSFGKKNNLSIIDWTQNHSSVAFGIFPNTIDAESGPFVGWTRGLYSTPFTFPHAFVGINGITYDLQTSKGSSAFDGTVPANGDPIVVGYDNNGFGKKAYLWSWPINDYPDNSQTSTNLNTLVSANDLNNGYLISANAISHNGKYIVGQGYHNGKYEAFIMRRW
ncbi:MAG: hypothetical protein HY960_07800 [Ignavibacteriae bacterium]|nr:hypothetical protein [Ignavibacteriota bacterium]